ncbi:MAG: hypothetical protein AAFX40_11970 [Cyanobacteria bacterium J06639_1]
MQRAKGWIPGIVLGAACTACGADATGPTVARPSTEVSLAFQDDAGRVTVEDAALTLAIAVLPTPPERLSELTEVANRLLGTAGAIAPVELTRKPDAICADLLAPDGLGIEDVAAVLALQTDATSPSEFDARLAALIPSDTFERTTLPTLNDLQQCAIVAIPTVTNLRLNKPNFALGEEVAIAAAAGSATGFAEFRLNVIAEIDLGFLGTFENEVASQTFTPAQADANCTAGETTTCTPAIALPLPESVELPNNAANVTYFAELVAVNPDREVGAARVPFSIQ